MYNAKEYKHEWYLKNKELTKERAYKWSQEHRDKRRIIAKNWREKNPRYQLEARKLWRKKNPFHKWKKTNAIAIHTLVQKQQGKCAICKRELVLCVDHDHKTLKIRGLLCKKCNAGIGFFEDNIEYLMSAIEYLKIHLDDTIKL